MELVTGEEDRLFNVELLDVKLAGQPNEGELNANPSMGWANACMPDFEAAQASIPLEPSEAYLSAVKVEDTGKSL